jgi:hypothetical protein
MPFLLVFITVSSIFNATEGFFFQNISSGFLLPFGTITTEKFAHISFASKKELSGDANLLFRKEVERIK